MNKKIIINGIVIPKAMFTRKFAPCDLAACRHACCANGCMMGEVRIAKINKALPELFPMMRPEAVKVVRKRGFHSSSIYKRSDFDSAHRHYSVRTVKGRCVFLNYSDKGGCALQRYCSERKMKYQFKPEGCWLFPFDQIGNRITFYRWKNLACLMDSKNRKSPPVYISCKKELTDILGRDGYKKLLSKAKILK
ncbi:MAG: DUF3109 family protein [Elusimicrobiota bacterium]